MKVTAYKGADGQLYETELEMAEANIRYWQRESARLKEPPQRNIPQPGDSDHHYSYDGGHQ